MYYRRRPALQRPPPRPGLTRTLGRATPSEMPQPIVHRTATPDDALTLSVLATQVFLDTYATRGVNIDLAKEVSAVYSPGAFEKRLQEPGVEISLATSGDYLVAFLDLDSTTKCPVSSVHGIEVLRLYVQSPFQRSGVGRDLMLLAERNPSALSSSSWMRTTQETWTLGFLRTVKTPSSRCFTWARLPKVMQPYGNGWRNDSKTRTSMPSCFIGSSWKLPL